MWWDGFPICQTLGIRVQVISEHGRRLQRIHRIGQSSDDLKNQQPDVEEG